MAEAITDYLIAQKAPRENPLEDNVQFPRIPSPSQVAIQRGTPESPVSYAAPSLVPAEFPEAWGGRPTGTSRRAIRMQREWDENRERQLKEAAFAREIYENDRAFALQASQQSMAQARFAAEMEDRLANQKLESQKEYEVSGFMQGFNQLDPRSPTFRDDVLELGRRFPLGRIDSRVSKIISDYEVVHGAYLEAAKLGEEKQREEIAKTQEKFSEARQLGISERQLAGVEDIDDQGNRFVNTQKLQNLIDTVKGERTLREEERKDDRGAYRPMSVDQAQDEADVAKAEVESLRESGMEDSEDFAKAEARARRAEAQLEVARKRASETTPPKRLGPTDQAALDWANANPEDPRSLKIKQRLGVK